METNKYQTPITQELLDEYPPEVQEQFWDFIYNVEFINWLVSPNRPYAKDKEKDENGRITVDLAYPHIIEDMDYFRQPALHFMKHGCYTFLKPNSNPHSEYRKFWDREIQKCREGYTRESDGEWVTGYCYWFLNYNPMLVNLITEPSSNPHSEYRKFWDREIQKCREGYTREANGYRDWETDRKSTRLNSSHSAKSRMPSSA